MIKSSKRLLLTLIMVLVCAIVLPTIVGAGESHCYSFIIDPGDNRVWPAMAYTNETYHLFLGHCSDGSDIRHYVPVGELDFREYDNSPAITRHDIEIAWKLAYTPLALEPHSVIWFRGKWWLYFGVKGIDRHWSIGYATTIEFDEWDICSKPCIVPSLREDNTADPHAVVYNNIVYLYYATTWLTPSAWQLCGAYSTDGGIFTKFDDGISCLINGYIPGEFLAIENGIIGFISDHSGCSYDMVFTSDGKSFNWSVANPILECGAGVLSGVKKIGHIAACEAGDAYFMYYVSCDNGRYRLERAEITELIGNHGGFYSE